MTASNLHIQLLGGFHAEIDGRVVPDDAWQSRRAASLVKLLAIAPRHRLTRDEVIEALWPEAAPDAGGANVRKAVHFARRALGDPAIGVQAGQVELWPTGRLSTDLEGFEGAARAALESGDQAALTRAARCIGASSCPTIRARPGPGRRAACRGSGTWPCFARRRTGTVLWPSSRRTRPLIVS